MDEGQRNTAREKFADRAGVGCFDSSEQSQKCEQQMNAAKRTCRVVPS